MPEAQAVTIVSLIPRALKSIEICPAAILPIIIGTKNGLILLGPFEKSTLNWSSIVSIPPIPHPNITPNRSLFIISRFKLESCIAILAPATAYWVNLSILFTSFLSI